MHFPYKVTLMNFVFNSKKKKNCVNKIKGGNPSSKSTRQMKTQVDTTQRKKTKANNRQK
jgi:hypothetical protein